MQIGTIPEIKLPPPAQLARLPEITAPAAELEELSDRSTAARQDLVEAEHARDRAAEVDRQNQADAVRAGTKAPAAKLPKAEAAVEKAKQAAEALEIAVRDSGRDLAATVAENTDAYRAKLAEEAEAQRAELQDAAAALLEKIAVRQDVFALRRWLADPTVAFNPAASGMRYSDIRRPNGEPFSVVDLAAKLAEAFAPTPPPEPKPEPSPLRRVMHAH